MKQDKKFIKTTIGQFLNEGKNTEYQVTFNSDKKGKIITPYTYETYHLSSNGYRNQILEISFSELYEGTFLFSEYNIIRFIIKSDNIDNAIELAKERLDNIFENGYPKRDDIVVVSGFKYDNNNNKISYNLEFMENTHLKNQFTTRSYETKRGDLLKYDTDGDGYGFWYAVDKNDKRLSDRLKGGTFVGYVSDGIINKY